MFKLLKIIAKAGNETVKYPFAPMPVSPGFRGKPEHDPIQCIACSACTMACPPNALTMDTDTAAGTRTWSLNVGRCIFCARCEEVCPTHAIKLSSEFELAVTRKEDLLQQATFTLARCIVCSEPFAAVKEIEYVISLMAQSGLPADELEAMRPHFETCPSCKRKQTAYASEDMNIKHHLTQGAA